jgi:elongation factor G
VAEYSVDKLRNIGLISHGGAGKTSLAEAMLFDAGAKSRLGQVEEGNTTMDHDPEEIARTISINAAIAPCEWNGYHLNIVDTPGYFDFMGEVRAALRVVDSALVLVDAVSGVQVGTELVWGYADEYELPRMVFMNKLDRENADFDETLEQLQSAFGRSVVSLQLPIGEEEDFRGIVDLLNERAYEFPGEGTEANEVDIPGELADQVAERREALIEMVVETDDELLMKYLEGEEITGEELATGLRTAVAAGDFVPVLCGAAVKNIGVQPLLDMITAVAPSPQEAPQPVAAAVDGDAEVSFEASADAPFSALVFKTMADPYVGKLTLFRVYSGQLKSDTQVYNANKGETERIGQLYRLKGKEQEPTDEAIAGDIVALAKLQETTTGDTLCDPDEPVTYAPIEFPRPVYSVAVKPLSQGDEEKIGSSLNRLAEEDPTFTLERRAETKETVISGLGEQHLDVVMARLERKFGVQVETTTPRVPYRETISRAAQAKYRHKKQSGGRGQFGEVVIELQPLPRGEEFEFVDKIFGGAISQQYRPAVEKGILEVMEEGVVAGYPVVDVKVELLDGKEHSVDSSEMAFKIAGSMAFRQAVQEAGPVLLEPIMEVEVMISEDYMGDIMGDLNRKRGRIQGMEPQGSMQVVKAEVPMAEMFRYAIDLRSMTQGRGTYTMEFSHYQEVPPQLTEQIIEEAQKEDEES